MKSNEQREILSDVARDDSDKLEEFIAEQIALYKKNFRESGGFWFGFQEAMEKVKDFLKDSKANTTHLPKRPK